jgi:hypothetical protein
LFERPFELTTQRHVVDVSHAWALVGQINKFQLFNLSAAINSPSAATRERLSFANSALESCSARRVMVTVQHCRLNRYSRKSNSVGSVTSLCTASSAQL